MALYYLDSSAVIKRYRRERGSQWVHAIYDHETVAVSNLASVELSSAVARMLRESRISMDQRDAMLNDFTYDLETCDVIEINRAIVTSASQRILALARSIPLRSLDAIQLACALNAFARSERFGVQTGAFVSADRRLLDAAAWAGLRVDNPEDHP